MNSESKATEQTRVRYQRIAPLYDTMEILAERFYGDWRERLWSLVEGPDVLEVGVGTGKNIPYYPEDVRVTAIDLASGMLQRARKRARELEADVDLRLGDVQNLDFADNTFDDVVSTFVFCSVPDPVLGLQELARVAKQGGRLLLLEHVRSDITLVGSLMDAIDPLVQLMGPHINRRTVQNTRESDWRVERVEDLGPADIFKLIVARKEGEDELRAERAGSDHGIAG